MQLFNKKPNLKEQIRASQRDLQHSVRDLEREMLALNREETKLVIDIKTAAKQGNQPTIRVLAKSLVRLRGQKAKLQAAVAQMRGVRSSITSASATSAVVQGMSQASKAMQSVGAASDPAKVMQSMQQFQKETAKMDMASEVMDDTLDGTLDDEDTEEETGALVNQVLDEIGVDLTAKMALAPARQTGVRQKAPSQAAEDAEADDLTARLQALK